MSSWRALKKLQGGLVSRSARLLRYGQRQATETHRSPYGTGGGVLPAEQSHWHWMLSNLKRNTEVGASGEAHSKQELRGDGGHQKTNPVINI